MSLWATAQYTPRGDSGRFISGAVTPAVRASVEAACAMIRDRAQQLCPVDTGALRESIQTTIQEGGNSIRGYVAPNMPYAAYVEFGTGVRGSASPGAGSGPYSDTWPGMPAQPYMRPAVDESREAVLGLFRDQLATYFRSPYA